MSIPAVNEGFETKGIDGKKELDGNSSPHGRNWEIQVVKECELKHKIDEEVLGESRCVSKAMMDEVCMERSQSAEYVFLYP